MIQKILGTGFTVSNLDRALAFYSNVLQFEHHETVVRSGDAWEKLTGLPGVQLRTATMKLGRESIELIEVSPSAGRAIPADSRSNDLWFQHIAIVTRDIDAAYARLRAHRVQHVSSMPQTLPSYIEAAAGIKAFYFRDPDGHNLELIQFPEGKGNPIWQHSDSLFLGIDHTAIGIASTPKSLAFYRDHLGLSVAGESENYGPEQEHLNMVFGAHLQITGLKAERGGLGLEFLDYLSPPGGRPMPADTRVDDLWYWETRVLADDLAGIVSELPPETVSPVVQQGNTREAIVRDPDGHFLRIMQLDHTKE